MKIKTISIIAIVSLFFLIFYLLLGLTIFTLPSTSDLSNIIWEKRIIETLVQPFLILTIILSIMNLGEEKDD